MVFLVTSLHPGAIQTHLESLQWNKRCCRCSYHIGNYESFKSSARNRGQRTVSILYFLTASYLIFCASVSLAFQVTQWVKNPPAMQETQEMWVQSWGWEDPLENGMASHSSLLAWRTPWTEEPGGLQSIGSQRVRQDRSNLSQYSTQHMKCW